MRVFTVIGPTQSGKTTLVDHLCGLEGRAQHFDIAGTVRMSAFSYLEESWLAIDIQGGPDALAYVGPALAASDEAVICVPPDPEAAVLVAPYLRLTEAAGIPCSLFINKMDAPGGRIREIVAALQAYCGHHIVLRQVPIREGGEIVGAVDLISERAWRYREEQPSALIELPESAVAREQEARTELLESLSDFDDHVLEQLIEDRQPPSEELYEVAARVLQRHDLVPAFLGAASHGNGVRRLMKAMRHEAPEYRTARARAEGDGAAAISIFGDIRKHIGKLVAMRAIGADVEAGAPLAGGTVSSVTDLDAKTPRPALARGEVGLAVKSDHLAPGLICTADGARPLPDWATARPPVFSQMVAPVHEKDDVRLSSALHRLAEIDPGLRLGQDEQTGKAVLGTQGPLHMRRLVEKLSSDFGLEIEAEPVPPEYRETVARGTEMRHRHRKQSGGAGQFAEVVIGVAPLPRGAGFFFEEVVKGGAVPRNYIPAVEAGAREALLEGPHGHRVVDLKVTLKDGKAHSVDSSDFAFRTAGKTALREALAEAGTTLLQPILRVEMHLPSIFVGDMVPLVSGLKGQVLGFEANRGAPGWELFNALIPASAQEELHRSLASATRGTGWAEVAFDHFEELRGAQAKATAAV